MHVATCMMTQKVLRNNAIRASRRVNIGTSGRSSSVLPIKWPVALAQIFSKLFIRYNLQASQSSSSSKSITDNVPGTGVSSGKALLPCLLIKL